MPEVGNFYTGIATGIFGRTHELEEEQKQLDRQQKLETLKFLGSQIDSVDPNSRPLLLQQMADVAGLKGKHRSAWDYITQQGRQDYHDQLSAKFKDIMGSMVGPDEYQKLKPHMEVGFGEPPAGGPSWMGVTGGMTPDRTAGKIALLDPTEEKRRLLEATYGYKSQLASNNIWERYGSTSQLQQEKGEIGQERDAAKIAAQADAKARGDVLKRAMQSAILHNRTKPNDEDLQVAAYQIGVEMGDHEKSRKILDELRIAQTGYTLSQTQVNADGTVGKPMTQGQAAGLSRQLTQDAIAVKTKWDAAYAKMKGLEAQETALRARLARTNPILGGAAKEKEYQFDEANGVFARADNTPIPLVKPDVQKSIAQLKQISAEKQQTIAEMEGLRQTLGSQYGDQYDTSDQWSIKPKEGYRSPSVTNPGGGQTYDATTPSGGGTQRNVLDVGKRAKYTSSNTYKPGEVISVGPIQYKVMKVLGGDGIDNQYEVVRLK